MRQDTAVGASLFTALAEDRDLSNAGAVRYSIDEVKHPSVQITGYCWLSSSIKSIFIISKIHFSGYSKQRCESV